MSEYANVKTRGAFISAVFAMQGCGILAAGIVSLIVSHSFDVSFKAPAYKDDRFGSTASQAGYVWRIILMFGALPAAFTYYWRMKMPETARYTALVAKDYPRACQDARKVLRLEFEPEEDEEEVSNEEISSTAYGLFSKDFLRRHGLHLLGTTTTWFFLDIAFYSQNLFQKDIFSSIGWLPPPEEMNAIQEVLQIAQAQTLIALIGTIPGYWFTVSLIDIIGRLTIQVMGFFFMTVFMFALAIPYHHWTEKNRIGFVVMYSLTFFFSNFGPNVTTFVIPAEIFPARMRSTCHGISAAAGKTGAIVGALGFLYASKPANTSTPAEKNNPNNSGYPPGIGVRNTLIILGCVNFLGMLFSFFMPETKGKSLEELSGENDQVGPKSKYEPGDYQLQSTSDQHASLRANISTRMWSPTIS